MREANTKDLTLLILLSIIWGSAFFNIKIATYTYDPITLVFVRVFFALVALGFYCAYKNVKILAFSKNWKMYALVGLTNITIEGDLVYSSNGTGIDGNTVRGYLAQAPQDPPDDGQGIHTVPICARATVCVDRLPVCARA